MYKLNFIKCLQACLYRQAEKNKERTIIRNWLDKVLGKFRPAILSLFILFIVSIISCGDVSNNTEESAPQGIWTGRFDIDKKDGTVNSIALFGIIAIDGSAFFLNPWGTLVEWKGKLLTTNSAVNGSLTGYAAFGYEHADGSQISSFQVSGTTAPRERLNGDFDGSGGSGSFSFEYSNLYERASSLQLVNATWSAEDHEGNISLVIDPDGNLFGTNWLGCIFNGSVKLIDPRYNSYRVKLEVSSCGIMDGVYTGLAFLTDEIDKNNIFILGVASDSYSWSMRLNRS